jgi:hypothetical protein
MNQMGKMMRLSVNAVQNWTLFGPLVIRKRYK